MEALFLLAVIPLLLLNLLGGVVGGVGLAIQGEWGLLVRGIVWCVVSPFLLSIAMLPAIAFAPLSVWASEKGNNVAALLAAVPALIWTYLVVTVSSVVIFHFVAARPDAGFIHLLWGYSMTTAPWSFLASKDKQAGNVASSVLMFFIQLGTVSMMLASWSDPASVDLETLAYWFVPFMLIGLVAQMFIAWVDGRSARRYGY